MGGHPKRPACHATTCQRLCIKCCPYASIRPACCEKAPEPLGSPDAKQAPQMGPPEREGHACFRWTGIRGRGTPCLQGSSGCRLTFGPPRRPRSASTMSPSWERGHPRHQQSRHPPEPSDRALRGCDGACRKRPGARRGSPSTPFRASRPDPCCGAARPVACRCRLGSGAIAVRGEWTC
jgi:hypothetical protein